MTDRDFIEAVGNGYEARVLELLDLGGKYLHPNFGGDRPFRTAASMGYISIARLLLERENADVHASNDQALISAVKENNFGMVQLLIDHGADVRADNNMPLVSATDERIKRLLEEQYHIKGQRVVNEKVEIPKASHPMAVLQNDQGKDYWILIQQGDIYLFNVDRGEARLPDLDIRRRPLDHVTWSNGDTTYDQYRYRMMRARI